MGAFAIDEGDPERGVKLAGAAHRMRELAGGAAPRAIAMPENPLELGSVPADTFEAPPAVFGERWESSRNDRHLHIDLTGSVGATE
jgi:hypothetical protein